MATAATNYATKAAIERAVAAARAAGVVVGGIELGADGTIRLLPPGNVTTPIDPFDEWKRKRQGG